MSLIDKTILLICDDEKVVATTSAAIKPLIKNLVVVAKSSEAVARAGLQVFDAILHRTKVATLGNPKEFFQWTQLQKAHKKTPWVVLGKDIESEDVLVTHLNVKFLEKIDDGAGLIRVLEGLLSASGKAKEGGGPVVVDVSIVNPLIGAVTEVLKSMAHVELDRGVPFVRKDPRERPSSSDISGIIAMNSDRFLGSLAICFSESLALTVYENILGAKAPSLDDDVKDLVAELTNIIFGHAKRDLNATGHTIAPAIPSVATGKGHSISHGVEGLCVCVPFSAQAGSLVVECVVNQRR